MSDQPELAAPEEAALDASPMLLRERLAKVGWSHAEFGRRTGIAPNTVSRWVRSELPTPKWACEYLRAMLAIRALAGDFGL